MLRERPCGYTKITYLTPDISQTTLTNPRWALFRRHGIWTVYEQMREDSPKERRFKTYDDWKRFLDELKAQEREERPYETHETPD